MLEAREILERVAGTHDAGRRCPAIRALCVSRDRSSGPHHFNIPRQVCSTTQMPESDDSPSEKNFRHLPRSARTMADTVTAARPGQLPSGGSAGSAIGARVAGHQPEQFVDDRRPGG